jgi:hypothetical protein
MIPRYHFSRIPNNDEGREFVKTLKKFLNKEKYSMTVRGQGIREGESWRDYAYSVPICKSSHLRVYIEDKQ